MVFFVSLVTLAGIVLAKLVDVGAFDMYAFYIILFIFLAAFFLDVVVSLNQIVNIIKDVIGRNLKGLKNLFISSPQNAIEVD